MSQCGKWALYGDSESPILVCGHSHAVAVMNALLLPEMKENSKSGVAVCYNSHSSSGGAKGEDYWKFVAESSRDKHVVLAWQGNQHLANFMFQTEPQFTILGATKDISPQEQIPIPLSMVKAFFRPYFGGLAEVVALMKPAKSITLLSAPPPKPLSHVKSAVLTEALWANYLKSTNTKHEILTSDSLRSILWSVVNGMLENYSHELGVNFLSAPSGSMDINGMLMSDYWESDSTHANSKYGLLLIEEFNRLFKEK